MRMIGSDDSLLVDISDALSERDRVRFTVHTRTKLPQFAKPVLSVVRQHEEFIWLHDCLEDNDQYAGYIIPPAPPKPDFDASREKLQRLGDSEANMTKEEFAKMKQELEAEYLAIFKKTVAMHEMFLQRLAAHEKFREDNNFKIFLEYENELAVRCKSKKERLAGSIQNIGKSLSDFVITTSQVAATNSASTATLLGGQSPSKIAQSKQTNGNTSSSDNRGENSLTNTVTSTTNDSNQSQHQENLSLSTNDGNNSRQPLDVTRNNNINNNNNTITDGDSIDEQYFEKERLFLALYHNSIRETAIQADKVTQMQRFVADSYLCLSQQLVKLASIQILPITTQTKDSSNYVACPLPSLTLPSTSNQAAQTQKSNNNLPSLSEKFEIKTDDRELCDDDDELFGDNVVASSSKSIIIGSSSDNKNRDKALVKNTTSTIMDKDYLEQAKKIETRIASDEDLKLTDTFLYYKRDSVAAQDLLTRRLRFMAEYETALRNLEKARQKGRTQMQYADVIQKQAKENFISISKLAKQELMDYKQRRVASFKKAFTDLVELELKHLRAHSQLITNTLNTCRGKAQHVSHSLP